MVTIDSPRGFAKDIGTVVSVLAAGVLTTAAVAHYGMDAKETGDYIAVGFSMGPPITVACGMVASGLNQIKQSAYGNSR
jgi:hypothetical protein